MMEYREWWENNKEVDELHFLNTQFFNSFSKELFNSDYRPLFYKFFKNEQLKHWNEKTFELLNDKINVLESQLGREKFIGVFLGNLELWISAYEQLLDIEERINLMELFNGTEELRAKIFTLSIYNDLLNSAYSNCLKLLIKFHGELIGKNQDQKTLTPQIDYLKKRGYYFITEISDSDIRNAISHGGVGYNGNKIVFYFTQGNIFNKKEMSVFQFRTDIREIFDITSAMCLTWLYYLHQNFSLEEIRNSDQVSERTQYFIDKLFLSTILFECKRIESLTPLYDRNIKQYNIEFHHKNLDVNSRFLFGIYSAQRLLHMQNIESGNWIYSSFQSSKSMVSFFKISTKELIDFSDGKIQYEDIVQSATKESMMWEVNDEERNEVEDNFRSYHDLNNELYTISEITDISQEDMKRFSAVFVLKEEVTKFQIKKIIKEAIVQIANLENFGFTNNKVKHGKMPADIVYLTVYQKQLRRNKKRDLLPENENFICYVQYDRNKKFPINIPLVDRNLKKNREGYLEYNWNPNYTGKKSNL